LSTKPPQGLKPPLGNSLMARLKPCPSFNFIAGGGESRTRGLKSLRGTSGSSRGGWKQTHILSLGFCWYSQRVPRTASWEILSRPLDRLRAGSAVLCHCKRNLSAGARTRSQRGCRSAAPMALTIVITDTQRSRAGLTFGFGPPGRDERERSVILLSSAMTQSRRACPELSKGTVEDQGSPN
jgi:hypothetical protein